MKYSYNKFARPYSISVVYPPNTIKEETKEEIIKVPLLERAKSVKDLVTIYEKEKEKAVIVPTNVSLHLEEIPTVLNTKVDGIAMLKHKLMNMQRYKPSK